MALDPEQKAQLCRITQRYVRRSRDARRFRLDLSRNNWAAWHLEHDFSWKSPFQSKEVLPDFFIGIQQVVATFERALTDSEDWLDVEPVGIGDPLLDGQTIEHLILHDLNHLYLPGRQPDAVKSFASVVSTAALRGLLEGIITFKVYPQVCRRTRQRFERTEPSGDGDFPAHDLTGEETGKPEEQTTIRLAVEVLPIEDYLPDPSGHGLYEIHRTVVPLHLLKRNPEYDQDAVGRLFAKATARERDADHAPKRSGLTPPDPFEIEVYECWGHAIDEQTGDVVHEDVLWTIAGDEVLREPTAIPNWDGTSPFISFSLVNDPDDPNNPPALADAAVALWRASNELFNLALDAAARGASGVGQLRPDIVEAPEEVAEGIPPNYTFALRPNVPLGAKAYEPLDTDATSPVSLQLMERVDAGLNTALAIPDTKLAALPPRNATATATVQAMQASGSLYESLGARVEDLGVEAVLEKCWKLRLQYGDFAIKTSDEEVVQVLGAARALQLQDMSAEDRYRLCTRAKFRARGLRGVAAKERMFTKLQGVLQLLVTSPPLLEWFQRTYAMSRFFAKLLGATGVDTAMFEKTDEERAAEEEAETAGAVGDEQLDPALVQNAPGVGSAPAPDDIGALQAAGTEAGFAANTPTNGVETRSGQSFA